MPAQKPTSIQDVLKTRQRDVFVGREEHLALFQRNLKLPPEDRRFIFNIWGQGGVGKSTLLRQFRMLAEQEIGALTALTDDVETAIKDIKLGGRVSYKMDRMANIGLLVGKRSFTTEQLAENIKAVVENIGQARPADIKGRYIKKMTVSSTMSPGIKLEGSHGRGG